MKIRHIDLNDPEEKKIKKIESKKETISANEFLEAVSSVSIPKINGTKKNNNIRTILPDDGIKVKIDEVVDWKKKEKEAKAERETRESEIIEYVKMIQNKDGFDGNYQKSYYVTGVKETITFVSADKFSDPKEDEIPELKELLAEKFDDFIKKEVEVKIRSEVLSNKSLQKELMNMIPKEYFAKFFESSTRWFVAEEFDRKRYSLPKRIFEKILTILPQSKPSIR